MDFGWSLGRGFGVFLAFFEIVHTTFLLPSHPKTPKRRYSLVAEALEHHTSSLKLSPELYEHRLFLK